MFAASRRRLTYLFTLSMGSILVLFAFTFYQRQIVEQRREFDEALYSRASMVAKKTASKFARGKQIDWEQIISSESLSESNLVCVRWYDVRKQIIKSLGECPRLVFTTQQWQTIAVKNKSLRVVTFSLNRGKFTVGYVQVMASTASLQQSKERSQIFFSFGVPIALMLTALVGWLLAGYAMRPIKRSYEQLQRFTADASHELRAPVAAILSNAQVGLLAPSDDPTQPRQRLENIVTQSKYMSDLIANLLFLARHKGKLNPQDISELDLVGLLTSLAEGNKEIFQEKQLELELKLPPVAKLKGDADLLRQAIANLLDNAIKYTPAGGKVTLKLEIKPRRLFVAVRDTGMGIPEADIPYIFDRFYRVDKARTRATGGFGLGLAIAKQIVEAHNGKLTVQSEVDKGTTFQICLPTNLR